MFYLGINNQWIGIYRTPELCTITATEVIKNYPADFWKNNVVQIDIHEVSEEDLTEYGYQG